MGKYGAIKNGKAERLYIIWRGMKRRCLSPKEPAFQDYGARGIGLDSVWAENYLEFKSWALKNGYKKDLTIDRKNNNGSYTPENCTWSDRKHQARNRRSSRLLTAFGKTQTIAEWSEQTGLSQPRIVSRLNKLNWDAEKAVS